MLLMGKDYLSKAAEYIEQEDFKKAIYACSQAISVNTENAEAYFTRANIRRELGEDEKALIDYGVILLRLCLDLTLYDRPCLS